MTRARTDRAAAVLFGILVLVVAPRITSAGDPGCDVIGDAIGYENVTPCMEACCYAHDSEFRHFSCTQDSWNDTILGFIAERVLHSELIGTAISVIRGVDIILNDNARTAACNRFAYGCISYANRWDMFGITDAVESLKLGAHETLADIGCDGANNIASGCMASCWAGQFNADAVFQTMSCFQPCGCGKVSCYRGDGSHFCPSSVIVGGETCRHACTDGTSVPNDGSAVCPEDRPVCEFDGGGPGPGECFDDCGANHFHDNVTATFDPSCQGDVRIIHVRSCDHDSWNQCLDCNVNHCAPGCPDTSCTGICDHTNACGVACMDCSCVCPGCAPRDCTGACGTATVDCLGECNGGRTVDCLGECGGGRTVDGCGQCGGDGSECACQWFDCFGTCNGGATVDGCGQCGGDGSECACQWFDCFGTCNGGASYDACGQCGGDGSECGPGPGCGGGCGGCGGCGGGGCGGGCGCFEP